MCACLKQALAGESREEQADSRGGGRGKRLLLLLLLLLLFLLVSVTVGAWVGCAGSLRFWEHPAPAALILSLPKRNDTAKQRRGKRKPHRR